MNKLVALPAVALLAVGIFLWKGAPATTEVAENRIDTAGSDSQRSSPNASSVHVSHLSSAKRVDPQFVTALGERGFSIARTGALRPEGDALDYIETLLAQSRAGDAVATFKIFLGVLDCKRLYSRATQSEDEADGSTRRLEECEALLTNVSIADADWLTLSAEQGGVEAMLMYAMNPDYALPGGAKQYLKNPEAVEQWRERSRAYLERAVAVGSQDAMLNLATAYGAGVIVDENKVTQLAYATAAQRLSPIPRFEDVYAPLRNSLTPTQRGQAEAKTKQILGQCCKD